MTSAIDKDDFDFENVNYRPEFSFPDHMPTIGADRMLFHFSNSLENRAVLLGTRSNFSTYLIDTSIKAKIPSDAFRQEKIAHWKSEHAHAKKWAFIEGGMGILLATGGVQMAAMTGFAAVLGVCSIAATFFGVANCFKMNRASHPLHPASIRPARQIKCSIEHGKFS